MSSPQPPGENRVTQSIASKNNRVSRKNRVSQETGTTVIFNRPNSAKIVEAASLFSPTTTSHY
jgi:hypothetical protein